VTTPYFVDAHHHLWDTAAHPRAWLTAPLPELVCGDHQAICHPYLASDFSTDVDELTCVGSVVIEAGFDGDAESEAAWLIQESESFAWPRTVVAFADLSAPDISDRLGRLERLDRVVGVREITAWHPDPVLSQSVGPSIMAQQSWIDGFGLLVATGLSFDLQIYPGQVDEAASALTRHPEVKVAIEHALMPGDRSTDWYAAWLAGLRMIAEFPQVVIKISGLGMFDHTWTSETIRPIFDGIVETFGPERCMLGSNFPVDSLYSSYATVWESFDELSTWLDPQEREQLFSGVAKTFYHLPEPPDPAGASLD